MGRSDHQLLGCIASGDRDAFAEFYDRHAPWALSLLLRWLGDRDRAEDVLQETFLQVWRLAPRYDPARSPPEAWLFLLARSRALDLLRRKRPETPPGAAREPAAADDPAREAERVELNGRVRDALAQLPAEQRGAIVLAFFGGLTYEEVARRQAVPPGTAKTRIRLGMKRLRGLLQD